MRKHILRRLEHLFRARSGIARTASSQRGFTLVELIIVVVIIGLISTLALNKIFKASGTVKADLSRTKINGFREQLSIYQMRNNQLPGDLKAADVDDPTDAWGRPVQYRSIDGNRYEIKSLGQDGKEGGSGADADIIVTGP